MQFLQSLPHPSLRNYIGQYIYISFNTDELPSLKQTFLPYDVPAVSIFVGNGFSAYERSQIIHPLSYNGQSVFAYYNSMITSPTSLYFHGDSSIKAFIVAFKPAGFSYLFRMDVSELTNSLNNFFSLEKASEVNNFFEQLSEVGDPTTQISIIDNFFKRRMYNRLEYCKQISAACKQIISASGSIDIKKLAFETNMSLRTLERKFIERVGVSPKLYTRFKRLHHALRMMNSSNVYSWTDITYSCGYYDQAHFIKEFKSFTLQSPSFYLPQEYMLFNQFILYRNYCPF